MRLARHGVDGLPEISWTGRNHLEKPMASKRSVLVLSAHFGNYWLIPLMLSSFGYRPAMLATVIPPTGRFSIRGIFRTYIYRSILPSAGIQIIDTATGARTMTAEALRQGSAVFVMADLPVGRVVPGRLLAIDHPLAVGPAEIAKSADAVLLPVMTQRESPGRHRVVVQEEIELQGEPEDAMRQYLGLLEDELRSAPPQWLWFNDAWSAFETDDKPDR
jgi:lauroyl/myristoyl acyltransferase